MAVSPPFTLAALYDGMPSTDRIFEIHVMGNLRRIRLGGPCKDDYARIVITDDRGQILKLQLAAELSFRSAEVNLGRQIALTGSFRSCAYQRELFARNGHDGNPPNRYAPPSESLHPRGLAIDVSQAQGQLGLINTLLVARSWHRVRPDEPWHYSYGGLG